MHAYIYTYAVLLLSNFSPVWPFETLWTVAHQASLSMGSSRQDYWSGLHALLQVISLTQRLNLCFLHLLHWQEGSLPLANTYYHMHGMPHCSHSATQSCPTLCDPRDCLSTPGFPVLHHPPDLAQTHVYWVGDAIQPALTLSFPSPSALNLSQHQGLF